MKKVIILQICVLLAGLFVYNQLTASHGPSKGKDLCSLLEEKSTTGSGIKKTGNENKKVYVYITRYGKKYHRENCRFLKKSKIKIELAKVNQSRYRPCCHCNPPKQ